MPPRWIAASFIFWSALAMGVEDAAGEPTGLQRDRARAGLMRPSGVGGCILAKIPAKVREEALLRLILGVPLNASLHGPVKQMASFCTSRSNGDDEVLVLVATFAALQKAAPAMSLAYDFGLEQAALEESWRTASLDEKAPFHRAAHDLIERKVLLALRAETFDVGSFAGRLGVAEPDNPQLIVLLREYFGALALGQTAEGMLAQSGAGRAETAGVPSQASESER